MRRASAAVRRVYRLAPARVGSRRYATRAARTRPVTGGRWRWPVIVQRMVDAARRRRGVQHEPRHRRTARRHRGGARVGRPPDGRHRGAVTIRGRRRAACWPRPTAGMWTPGRCPTTPSSTSRRRSRDVADRAGSSAGCGMGLDRRWPRADPGAPDHGPRIEPRVLAAAGRRHVAGPDQAAPLVDQLAEHDAARIRTAVHRAWPARSISTSPVSSAASTRACTPT